MMMSFRTAALGVAFSFFFISAAGAEDAVTPDWSKAQTVEVTLTNYAFSPQSLHLRRGMPYRLHFVNNGSKSHNFDSDKFFAAVTIVPEDRAKVTDGKVELEEGQSTDVRLIPVTPGTYPVSCSHFLHAMLGMRGEAVIE
ncbi:MAG: cupredoxin domain-containing protein [Proteobacteria bacterium]|nr:cupredoxin domain-containing protein [Pseudomonadota bacterium]